MSDCLYKESDLPGLNDSIVKNNPSIATDV